MNKEKISFELKNNLSELDTLFKNVEQLENSFGLSKKLKCHCALALEELFTNIIFYGYTDHTEHWIKLSLNAPLKNAKAAGSAYISLNIVWMILFIKGAETKML